MQSVSSRIWTRVAVSISYDDNSFSYLFEYRLLSILANLNNAIFLDDFNTSMLGTMLNKSLKEHSTKQQLYSHLPTNSMVSPPCCMDVFKSLLPA